MVVAGEKLILLHGLGASTLSLLGLKMYLSLVSNYDVHCVEYPSDKLYIDQSVKYVESKLRELLNAEEQFIVVGQSLGGVVGHRLADNGWNIRKLVTIGSPLKGARFVSKLKDVVPTKIQSLLHKPAYEDLIYMTNDTITTPPCPYHCITMSWPMSDFDGCVYRDEGSFDTQFHTHLNCADHRTIFANPRLWYTVHRVI